jgi:hypothetical protein
MREPQPFARFAHPRSRIPSPPGQRPPHASGGRSVRRKETCQNALLVRAPFGFAGAGRQAPHHRDGAHGEAGGGCRRRDLRRQRGAGDGDHGRSARGNRLLPPHGGFRREDVRRRQDPGRLLQARGAALGSRDPRLPLHRPLDPAALRGGLPRRGAGDGHRARARRQEPAGHRRLHRRFRGAHAVADPVPRSDRRGAHRSRRGPVGRESSRPRAISSWSSPARARRS